MAGQNAALAHKRPLLFNSPPFYRSHKLFTRVEQTNDCPFHHSITEVAVYGHDAFAIFFLEGEEHQFPPSVEFAASPFSLVYYLAFP